MLGFEPRQFLAAIRRFFLGRYYGEASLSANSRRWSEGYPKRPCDNSCSRASCRKPKEKRDQGELVGLEDEPGDALISWDALFVRRKRLVDECQLRGVAAADQERHSV